MSDMVSVSSYHASAMNGRKTFGKVASPLSNSFSLLEYSSSLRFLIMDCPTNSTIPLYLKEFSRLNVTDIVRVCEPTYSKERLIDNGVMVHDLPFKDGDVPPPSVIKVWLGLVSDRTRVQQKEAESPQTIAIHCVAGLGRAPVLVAVALIEQGMDAIDAIELVRRKRRGAFNNRQITYLVDQYKRSSGSRARTSGVRSGAATPSSQSPPQGPVTQTHKSFFRKMFGGSH
ncbi:hypothetical protein H4219_002710 [Mycoemilia scoparia]|uniref:protein-tyrosine-phosphatase n=1 Tax=Mycoemilia scoparia TaxID=417184 RepID=A0A9W8DNR7_9FUNG|nr:hypothetical protein H4219_002710 [Mycoemilia scoparia]